MQRLLEFLQSARVLEQVLKFITWIIFRIKISGIHLVDFTSCVGDVVKNRFAIVRRQSYWSVGIINRLFTLFAKSLYLW